MKKVNIKSDGQHKREKKDLEKLTLAYSQAGLEEVTPAAILVQFFRDNPHLLRHQEGRALLKLTCQRIKGSYWEDILNPESYPQDDQKLLNKIYFELDEKYGGDRRGVNEQG